MAHFEKAQEIIHRVADKATEVGYGAINSIENARQNMRNAALGATALFSAETTLALLVAASPAAAGENCGYQATHPEYLPTAGSHYVGKSLNKLHVNSIDLPSISETCAERGDRQVRIFAQTRGENGNWRVYSNSGIIKDNGSNVYNTTLTTERFKGVPGPKNRAIRVVEEFSYIPDGAKKPSAKRWVFEPVMKYGPGGDGV